MSALSTVQMLKESLSKQVSADINDIVSVDKTKDVLNRLEECEMTLDILTRTLIGTLVGKLKHHEALGDQARSLIKKWRAIAKSQSSVPQPSSDGSRSVSKIKLNSMKPSKEEVIRSMENNKKSSKSEKKKTSSDGQAERLSVEGGSNDDDISQYWQNLSEHRRNVAIKIHSILLNARPQLLAKGINAVALNHLHGQRAAEIEEAIFLAFPGNTKAYSDKARSIAFNLKKNINLSISVILRYVDDDDAGISVEDLVSMTSEQLASDSVRIARAKEAQKVIDSRRLDWDQANEDKINEMCGITGDLLKASLFTCGRCKSTKTTSTQKQTRSADEPMTVFVLCLTCGKRWKC